MRRISFLVFWSVLCAFVASISTQSIANASGVAPRRSQAGHDLKKSPGQHILDQITENNERLSAEEDDKARTSTNTAATLGFRPFADYEKTGYVFISSAFNFGSKKAKLALAEHLPPDVTLVIYTENGSKAAQDAILKEYSKVRPASQIKIIELSNASNGFWSRDGLPVPVVQSKTGDLGVVDADYYYAFEPDQEVATAFGSPIFENKYGFEGGNFMANDKGDCLMVNKRSHRSIPDSTFENSYGCKRVIRLPHVSGIGHVDEHARFVSADTIITDLASYKTELEAKGFKVAMVPRPSEELYTHVNSLIVNGVAFVPVYGESSDAVALKVYEDLGFKAVGVESKTLSGVGEGSIHCITMTYPASARLQ